MRVTLCDNCKKVIEGEPLRKLGSRQSVTSITGGEYGDWAYFNEDATLCSPTCVGVFAYNLQAGMNLEFMVRRIGDWCAAHTLATAEASDAPGQWKDLKNQKVIILKEVE